MVKIFDLETYISGRQICLNESLQSRGFPLFIWIWGHYGGFRTFFDHFYLRNKASNNRLEVICWQFHLFDFLFHRRFLLSLFGCLLVLENMFERLLHELGRFSLCLGFVFCALKLFRGLFAATFLLLIGRSLLLFLWNLQSLFSLLFYYG